MRRAFSDTLVEVADVNDKMVFLTGDLGFEVFTELEKKHPTKYINAGIAEAQLAMCATGLALSGFRPVIYSIASFMTGRAFELIRTGINYQQLPVLIIGAGGGYTYANSGVTHHAAEDLGLMQLMPGMQIINPGSPSEVRELMLQFFEQDKPAYMRVGRFGEPEYTAKDPIILGKARLVSEAKKQVGKQSVALLSTGDTVISCIEANKLLKEQGFDVTHYQYHSLSPFDVKTLEQVLSNYDHVIVVEDHFPIGGLYSQVSSFHAGANSSAKLTRLGPPHELLFGEPSIAQLREQFSYDVSGIVSTCMALQR